MGYLVPREICENMLQLMENYIFRQKNITATRCQEETNTYCL